MSFAAIAYILAIPPLSFLSIGLLGLVLAATRWRRLGRVLQGIAILGLLVFALPVTGRSLFASLERDLPHTPVQPVPGLPPPQAIVILGGDAGYGAAGGVNAGSGIGALTLERMRAGALLHRSTGLPVLTTGGTLEPEQEPIGAQMAASLEKEFATPVRWVEARSADTWQNAEYSAKLLHESGIDSIYLVTHAWHMRRAMIAFARFGIHVHPAPLRYDRPPDFDAGEFLPYVSAWQVSYYATHEWIGCAYYTLRR